MIFTKNERKIHYMGAILEYKCPCCSGPLQFDTDAQKMKCPYCDNEFDAEASPATSGCRESLKGRRSTFVIPAAVRSFVTIPPEPPTVPIAEAP